MRAPYEGAVGTKGCMFLHRLGYIFLLRFAENATDIS